MKLFHLLLLASSLALSSCNKKDCNNPDACSLEPDAGICEAYFPKFYYDTDSKTCKEFIWGGCNGTIPFETLEQCWKCECSRRL